MSKIKIIPKKLKGEISIPPSKSMAHRAVICASLSKGISIIENIEFSDDIIATIEGMKALGANIKLEENKLIINGEGIFKKHLSTIDCNESGSTLRFLVPLSLVRENDVRFIGRGNLGRRPLDTYYEIFQRENILYSQKQGELDLRVKGRLKGGLFKINGNISSQFITGLLFTLPLLNDNSRIIVTTTLESKAYVDLTISMMKKFGVIVENIAYKEFIIRGNQEYKPFNYRIEGDYSQAAFYLCADALGSDISCNNLDLNSLQGDRECIEILQRMGAKLDISYMKILGNCLNATIIDAAQCPDIIPVLTVVSALSKGETRIINAERLRIKECDRLKAITSELNKLGANIKELSDGLIINGVEAFKGGEVFSHNDHRIAMSLAIASTRCSEPMILEAPECVKKSYPSFWDDFRKIGGIVNEWSMGK